MEPLMIRDRRYWLQKEIEELDAEEDAEQISSLKERIASLQEICPHQHDEEVPDENLWHCRDCDARRPLDPDLAEEAEEEEDAPEGDEAEAGAETDEDDEPEDGGEDGGAPDTKPEEAAAG